MPVFVAIWPRLSPRSFDRTAERAGLAGRYTGHSLRRGGAAFGEGLLPCGLELLLSELQGGCLTGVRLVEQFRVFLLGERQRTLSRDRRRAARPTHRLGERVERTEEALRLKTNRHLLHLA